MKAYMFVLALILCIPTLGCDRVRGWFESDAEAASVTAAAEPHTADDSNEDGTIEYSINIKIPKGQLEQMLSEDRDEITISVDDAEKVEDPDNTSTDTTVDDK